MIVNDRGRGTPASGRRAEQMPGPGLTDTDTSRAGVGERYAVVVPVSGEVTLEVLGPDVVALVRAVSGARMVERLRLGAALIPTGVQMWVDEDGLHTGLAPNPRATALVAAHFPTLRLAQHVVGTAVFTGADHPSGEYTLGLATADALTLRAHIEHLAPTTSATHTASTAGTAKDGDSETGGGAAGRGEGRGHGRR